MKNKNFNIVVAGTGGQGLLTVLDVLSEAAIIQGFDIKTSELHGLSQRGGSINTHIRMGQKVYSPLVPLGSADLILSLELLETLRTANYANDKTIYLVNCFSLPFVGTIPEKEITQRIKKLLKGKKHIISAAEICQKELGKNVLSGIYLISYAAFKKMIPLKPASILKAIEKVIPPRYLEINQKAFNLAKKQEA
jgi:indolepyruvate ferredoxin oxidoreductase beta subunit